MFINITKCKTNMQLTNNLKKLKKTKNLNNPNKKPNLPENATRVFKGILFDVYHWQQKMFDGSYRTFEAIKRIDTVQIIAITTNKKIIMLKEEQPFVGEFISVPGGQIERYQTPIEAVNIELLEETGGKSNQIELWQKRPFGSKIQWNSYYYIAKDIKIIQAAKPEIGEKIKTYEVTFEEFLEETQKEEFRNKTLADIIFRIIHTKGELEKFKKLLLN